MFNGRETVDPGLVLISYWRPDGGQPAHNADRVWGYCGVADVTDPKLAAVQADGARLLRQCSWA